MGDPRGLERQVWFYRLVALMLLVLVGMLALKLKRIGVPVGEFGNEGEVWAVDLDERVPYLEETRGERADYSESYFYSPLGSVHLHAMGHQQTTPLHLHPASDEFTVIVSGTAHVTQAWGADGGIVSRTADFPAGSGLGSGRFTAHEWVNQSSSAMLFNLVFTSPTFTGNFYVHGDDPRILEGRPPTTVTVEADANRPELGGRLHTRRVADAWTVPDTNHKPIMALVTDGTGQLGGITLRKNVLVHLEHEGPLNVKATTPLSLLLFDVTGNALTR